MFLNQLRNHWAKRNLSSMTSTRNIGTKPPNIIIKTECKQSFEKVNALVSEILERDRYTIHHSTTERFLQASWKESCCLLMLDISEGAPPFCRRHKELVASYVTECNGNVIFYSEGGNKQAYFKDVDFLEKGESTGKAKMFQTRCTTLDGAIGSVKKSDLIFILNCLGVDGTKNQGHNDHQENAENLQTPGYLLSLRNKTIQELFKLSKEGPRCIVGKNTRLLFPDDVTINNHNSEDNKDFIINSSQNELKPDGGIFNRDLYQRKLNTKQYGQNIIYTNTINSTQTIFTDINVDVVQCNGLVVHAKRQLKGKGRTGNQWLSPLGCMMFSMQIRIPVSSPLGRSLPMIQHLVIVAFVKSIKNRGEGYENLDLHIKWPNDVYIKKSVKIGGIIVNSCLWKNEFRITVGLGVNVSNEIPTDCLNSLIRSHNAKGDCNLSELEIEDALAGTLNEIELLVDKFQSNGVEAFKREYYQHWLHSGVEVALECHNMEKAVIVGIDDCGYLIVQLKRNGVQMTLQPDGNSFDMMRNMIVIKS